MLTRRQFSTSLLAGGTALLASETLLSPADSQAGVNKSPDQISDQRTDQSCDLLIKGGTVLDPGQHLRARMDVAVKGGKILEVSPDIPESRAAVVYSARDKIVTPGFIDLHVHCFDGVGSGMNADHYCLGRGVTTVVDAGSTGFIMVGAFIKHIVKTSTTRIHALVDIGALGTMTIHECPNYYRDMYIPDFVLPEAVAKAAKDNRPDVVGIKIHLDREVSSHPLDFEPELMKKAVQAAEAAGLPLMVHAMNTANLSPDLMKFMRKGDVFTHCFHGFQNGILDDRGKILPGVREARARGILFDVGADRNAISFDVAEQALQQDFLPDTISSDLTVAAATHSTGDLPNVVSKLMALGMNLEQSIERVTHNPAQVFDFGMQLGTLRAGAEADIGIFEIRDEKFEFNDNFDFTNPKVGKSGTRIGRQKLVNKAAVCRGQLFVNEM
jgi:dihydroorotase